MFLAEAPACVETTVGALSLERLLITDPGGSGGARLFATDLAGVAGLPDAGWPDAG